MNLEKIRKKIDKIDKSLIDLLNKRLKYVLEIKTIKKNKNINFIDFFREKKIICNLQKYNKGPLTIDSINEIFKTILITLKKN